MAGIVVGLVLARLAVELWLAALNRRHAMAHAGETPPAFRDFIAPEVYQKSLAYTLAKGRFGDAENIYSALVLLAVLFSGFLPWSFRWFSHGLGSSAWAMAGYLFAVGLVLSVLELPWQWLAQFRLEQKFGFNTTTPGTWWGDRAKGLLLSLALGYPLLALGRGDG